MYNNVQSKGLYLYLMVESGVFIYIYMTFMKVAAIYAQIFNYIYKHYD